MHLRMVSKIGNWLFRIIFIISKGKYFNNRWLKKNKTKQFRALYQLFQHNFNQKNKYKEFECY